jgi:hypothetical protein
MAKVNHNHSHPVAAKPYAADAARPLAQQGRDSDDDHPIVLTARDWEAFLAAWDSDRPPHGYQTLTTQGEKADPPSGLSA